MTLFVRILERNYCFLLDVNWVTVYFYVYRVCWVFLTIEHTICKLYQTSCFERITLNSSNGTLPKTNAIAYKEKRYRYINPIRMYIDWTDCYYLPFKSRFRFLPTSFLLFLLYNIIIWSVLYLIIKVANKGFWKLIQIMRIFHIYNWSWLWKFYEDFFKIKTWNKNQCIVYEQEILVLTWHQYFGKRGSFVIPI